MKKETKITHFFREMTSEDRGQEICRQSSKDLQATTVDVASGNQESTAFQVSKTNEEATCSGPQSNSTPSKFFSSQAVLEAEIHWVIKMVRSHYSFNSSSDVSVIFNQMFPDRGIAKRFSCEKLLEKIKKTLSPLDPNKLLQISMDGPMVNWKFLKMLQEDKRQSDPSASKLLHLGSCALHVVHGSFQGGEKETGWKVGDVLRALWQLFHDSPARPFPLKFCAHRWVEDMAVAKRAIEIWPAVQMYINSHRKLPKSKVPSSASYCTVKEATADHLFCLLSSYIKREELEKLKTPLQLLKLDPQDKANHVPLKQLDTGFECIYFLSMTCKKMMERSSLMFKWRKFKRNILAQYKIFSIDINTHHKAEFQHFAYTSRLDRFLGNLISGRPEYTALWDLIKHLLTLSHGQGAVERGHSINKDMLVENLKERSLVALRMVQDAVAEHPMDEVLPRDLILHCKGARMRYVQYLEDEKKKKVETANERKRKDLQQEIANVNAK
ncbi:hypothetical protein Q7C36_016034 [Tachysurus vachellii]|uniref:Uncharacterized protein n=1 Tax=Tachysurus vachellii TaxID=175792 RepID=A0AA88M7T4_TACVA|nr:hypothetical protein Q7C36_016034 [Tachysurus vachellii]